MVDTQPGESQGVFGQTPVLPITETAPSGTISESGAKA